MRAGATPVLVDCDDDTAADRRRAAAAAVTRADPADRCRCTSTASWRPSRSSVRRCADRTSRSSRTPRSPRAPRRHGAAGRLARRIAGDQLLPGQEPRRLRRRRRGAHGRRATWRRRAGCCATTAARAQVRARRRRHQPPARHAAGGRAVGQAAPARRLERRPARRGRPLRRRCSPTSTGVARPVAAAGNEHVWHLYVVRVADRDQVLAELNAARHRRRRSTTRCRSTCTAAFADLGQRPGRVPRGRAARRTRSSRCRCSPASPRSSRSGWSTVLAAAVRR